MGKCLHQLMAEPPSPALNLPAGPPEPQPRRVLEQLSPQPAPSPLTQLRPSDRSKQTSSKAAPHVGNHPVRASRAPCLPSPLPSPRATILPGARPVPDLSQPPPGRDKMQVSKERGGSRRGLRGSGGGLDSIIYLRNVSNRSFIFIRLLPMSSYQCPLRRSTSVLRNALIVFSSLYAALS